MTKQLFVVVTMIFVSSSLVILQIMPKTLTVTVPNEIVKAKFTAKEENYEYLETIKINPLPQVSDGEEVCHVKGKS